MVVISETITAKDFFLNTFNHDFLLPDEKETIIMALELFAKGKCKEQREICANTGKHQKFGLYQYKKEQMINAKEPEF